MEIKDKEGTVLFVVCYPFPEDWLDHKYPQVMVMTRFLVLYIAPLTIIGIFYLLMANHLIVSTRNVPGEMQGTQRQVRKCNSNYLTDDLGLDYCSGGG